MKSSKQTNIVFIWNNNKSEYSSIDVLKVMINTIKLIKLYPLNELLSNNN